MGRVSPRRCSAHDGFVADVCSCRWATTNQMAPRVPLPAPRASCTCRRCGRSAGRTRSSRSSGVRRSRRGWATHVDKRVNDRRPGHCRGETDQRHVSDAVRHRTFGDSASHSEVRTYGAGRDCCHRQRVHRSPGFLGATRAPCGPARSRVRPLDQAIDHVQSVRQTTRQMEWLS